MLGSAALVGVLAFSGEARYESLCARCHGSEGTGGEMALSIAESVATRTDEELFEIVRVGLPGMPGFRLADDATRELVGFLRTLQPGQAKAPERDRVETAEGRILEGVVLNQSSLDLQLRTDDERIHLLRKGGERHRAGSSAAHPPPP